MIRLPMTNRTLDLDSHAQTDAMLEFPKNTKLPNRSTENPRALLYTPGSKHPIAFNVHILQPVKEDNIKVQVTTNTVVRARPQRITNK